MTLGPDRVRYVGRCAPPMTSRVQSHARGPTGARGRRLSRAPPWTETTLFGAGSVKLASRRWRLSRARARTQPNIGSPAGVGLSHVWCRRRKRAAISTRLAGPAQLPSTTAAQNAMVRAFLCTLIMGAAAAEKQRVAVVTSGSLSTFLNCNASFFRRVVQPNPGFAFDFYYFAVADGSDAAAARALTKAGPPSGAKAAGARALQGGAGRARERPASAQGFTGGRRHGAGQGDQRRAHVSLDLEGGCIATERFERTCASHPDAARTSGGART